MAGKVAKYGSLSMSFGAGKNNSEYRDEGTSSNGEGKKSINSRSGNIMEDYLLIEEDVIIKSLGIEVEREKALKYLDRQFQENNSLLIFQDKTSLFQGFAQALSGNDINVRIECTKLIAKVIPQLGPDLEQCMSFVLPKIVSNIGNITGLQKESIQTLHICMKHASDVYHILKVIADNGIKHEDPKTRKQIIHTFPTLLFPEFKNEDFFEIVLSLVQNLNENESDNHKVLKTISHVKKFVGIQRFKSYIHDLPPPLQSLYGEMMVLSDTSTLTSNRSTPSLPPDTFTNGEMGYQRLTNPNMFDRSDNSVRNVTDFSQSGYFDSSSMKNSLGKGFKVKPSYLTPSRSPEMLQSVSPHFEFGFIPRSIIENLSSTDNKVRSQAVEDLKNTINNMRDITPLRQNIIPLISLLHPVVEDNHYKVSCGAFQILGFIVQRIGPDIRPYVKMLSTTASKRIGSKDVIRSECMKVLLTLAEVTDPGLVLEHFYGKLQHKQAKIREETVNLIIATLLKFPGNKSINFTKLLNAFMPILVDPKPRLRFVAFECLSAMKNYYSKEGKDFEFIINAVNDYELNNDNANGLMSAVLDRLFRKKLPKLKDNMLVEYSMSSSSLGYSDEKGSNDLNWIMSASNNPTSQSSLSHFSTSTNSSYMSANDPYGMAVNAGISGSEHQRRHPSAGKRGVFPWAKENSEKIPSSAPSQSQRNNLGESHPPLRPRATWGPENQERTTGQTPVRTRPNRANESNAGAGSGGYLEIHQRKQANAVSKESLTNVGAPPRQRKQVDGESTGLHSAPSIGRNMGVADAGGYQPSFGSNDVTARQPRANIGPLKQQSDTLSNSCPTTFFNANGQVNKFNKSPRRGPLSSVTGETSAQKSIDEIINEPGASIPIRPQLARSAQRRGSPKQENQLSVQSPLKWNKTASPRLDRIADNPTLDNVRPLMKQNRGFSQTDPKLNSSLSDFLDSPVMGSSGYTPSGLQQKANTSSNGSIPMAVIRHPAHQMKSSGVGKQTMNESRYSEIDANSGTGSHKRKDPNSGKFQFDHYPEGSGVTSDSKSRHRNDKHDPLKSTKSLPSGSFPAEMVTHPLLLQQAAQPVQSETPRTAPHSGSREEEVPSKASSLDLIRHSAQKKRNQMQRSMSSGKELSTFAGLDGSLNSTLSGSNSGRATAPESSNSSGILSPLSNNGKADIDSNPFMTKASIARPGSGKGNGNSPSPSSIDPPPFKYNPNSGVSINTQKTKTNVSVVGHSYGLRSGSSSEVTAVSGLSPATTPTNSSTSIALSSGASSVNSKPSLTSITSSQSSKEKRRNQRGSSLGMSMTNYDQDDNFNIQGKAIGDTNSSNYSPTSSKDDNPSSLYSNDTPTNQPPDGVVGKAVQHQSVSSDVSNEDKLDHVPLSKSLRATQLEKKRGTLRSHASEQDVTSLKEKYSSLSIDQTSPTNFNATGPLQPSKPRRQMRSPNSRVSPPRPASLDRRSGSSDSSALRTTTEILPCAQPEKLLNEAITALQNQPSKEEWEINCNSIHIFRRLATFHQDVLSTRIHEVLFLLNKDVSNLRSQVSRAAVVCLTDVYTHLKKPAIDVDIEATTKALMHGIGRNTGAFMQEEITKTFQYIVANVTSAKVLNALLAVVNGNRNTSVRNMTAQFVSLLVEKMGPGKALSGVKDMTEKIIPAAASFTTDSSQVTRYYGRCIVKTLMNHQDFEKCVEKFLNQKQAKEMKEAAKNIETRGVGTLGSAGTRSQGSGVRRNGSTNGLRRMGNSASSDRLPQISSTSSRRSTPARTTFNEMDQEEIRVMCTKLNEGKLQEKRDALGDLREKMETNRPLVEDNIVRIMDGLRSLLTTANSKLNTLGMEMVITLIPELGNILSPTDLVPAVCRLLVSKQQNIAQLAMKAVNLMLEHIDHMSLLQQFANCAMYSPGKTKQVCIEKLAELVNTVSARKPQAVERHVWPVLLSLMSEKHAMSLKRETTILAKALHAAMGDNLLQYAEAKNVKSKIVEMIES